MSAFTKGPWRYCGADRAGGCCCGQVWSLPADFHVATAHRSHDDSEITREEMLANAALMSAAPCLLSAGSALAVVLREISDYTEKFCRDVLECRDVGDLEIQRLFEKARSAVSAQQAWKAAKDKATGKGEA